MPPQKQENTRVNYINANANANVSAKARNGKSFIFVRFHLRLRLHFKHVNRGNANANANARIIKKTGSSALCHHGLDEKLADSIRKYTVLYDKRCADKLKKTLAWKDFAKEPRDKKTVCITIKNINSKYNQINWIPYKRIFSVALNRYFFRPLSTLRLSFTRDRHLGKSLTVLDCAWVFCLPCVWFWRMKVVCSCICICVARVNQALRLFTVLAQWRYSLDSNVNTPFLLSTP